jgi:hypothetical protein
MSVFPGGHNHSFQAGLSPQSHVRSIPIMPMSIQPNLPIQPPNTFQMFATGHLNHQPTNEQPTSPFVDLTKYPRPSETGVMKIGNVSK